MFAALVVAGAGTTWTARAAPGATPVRAHDAGLPADTDSVAGDSAARDSAARDSAARDSAARDSAARDSAARGPVAPIAVGRDTLDRDTTESEAPAVDFPGRDSTFERLAGLAGYRTVEYRGETVELHVRDEAVRLRGSAHAKYGTNEVEADAISYLAGLQFLVARNKVTLSGQGQNVTTDTSVVYYDISRGKGTIMDARTSFAERGAEWFIRGDATLRGQRTAFVETGAFTSCELDEPHYYFKAGRIKVVTQNVIVAWPVTLYIHDVPVAWLPFFAQDIRPGRRSGFLPPRFGVTDIVSTSDNVSRSVTDFGYYLALNDFMDAQASIDWFSGNFTRVNTAFRYKVLKKFLQGNLFASYSFGDRRTVQVRANHQQQITPVTDFRVDANFISNTQVFEEREFDPTFQTQQITSDVGFNHRFSFASVNLSARRNQSLGTLRGNTELTLPRLNMTFTPLTLFRAPRGRAGPFNNMVLSGGFGFTRRSQTREAADDQLATDGNVNSSLRIGSFGVGGNASFNTQKTTPFDSLGMAPDPFSTTRVNYSAQADYQVDLVGSTTFRPTVSLTGSAFRSPDTDDEFISAPSRLRVGATLSTDLYGFLPGFGPFSRIRHKVSPRFNFSYSPAVEVADSLLSIPGFPVASARQENRLQVTLNQTFEAKLREDVQLTEEEQALLEGRPLEEDSLAVPAGETAGEEEGEAEGEPAARPGEPETGPAPTAPDPSAEAAGEEAATRTGQTAAARPGEPGSPGTGQVPRRAQQRNVVLLAINSSALDFDFALEGEPKLVTDRWSHRINSDLLRGLALNLSLDLFKGVGEEREFSPILSELTGSFTFSSARGLGGLLGLGGGGAGARGDPQRRIRQGVDSRYRLQTFEENPDPRDPGLRGAGPWNLSLTYSLSRRREEEGGEDRQSMGAILSLTPTPNWSLSWRTDYNLTDGEFGRHLVTLDRDLHRWVASFVFARSPNGNLIFQMSVALRDAPDLKFDYDQRTLNR